MTIRRGGTPSGPITLAAGPQGNARLNGRLWVTDQANDVVVRDLVLDGRNASNFPSPTINGDRVSFVGNDVFNGNTTICFSVGSIEGYGLALNTLIDGNRIHNCGVLPAQNHHHGIYVEASRNAVIRGNFIYDNADKGILIFPDGDGTLIERNVIDGNTTGILIAGSMLGDAWHPAYPKDTVIRLNVITNSRRYNIEGYWEWKPPADVNNAVTRTVSSVAAWADPAGRAGVALGCGLRRVEQQGQRSGVRGSSGQGLQAPLHERLHRLWPAVHIGRRACSGSGSGSGACPGSCSWSRPGSRSAAGTGSRSDSRSAAGAGARSGPDDARPGDAPLQGEAAPAARNAGNERSVCR